MARGARTDSVAPVSQPPCTVLLTEEVVSGPDLERILALHPSRSDEPGWTYRVLVHLGEGGSRLAEAVDHVVLGELREAVEGRGEEPGPREQAEQATEVLAGTLAALRGHGRTADGTVTTDDPVEAVAASVTDGDAQEVVVVSRPRFVEDTLHRDWASRLREVVPVPVLHVYGGTTSVG